MNNATTLANMAHEHGRLRRRNTALQESYDAMKEALLKTEGYVRDVCIQESLEFEDLKTVLHLMATVGAPATHHKLDGEDEEESWERAGFEVTLMKEETGDYAVWVQTPWWHKAGTGRFRYPEPVGRVKLEQWSTYATAEGAAYLSQHDAARSYATRVMSIAAVSGNLLKQFGIEPDPNLRENITIEPCYFRFDAGGRDFFMMKAVNVRYLGSPIGTYKLSNDLAAAVNGKWGTKGTLTIGPDADRFEIDTMVLQAKRALDEHRDAILDELLDRVQFINRLHIEEGLYHDSERG